MEVVELCKKYRDDGVVAIDLAGDESLNTLANPEHKEAYVVSVIDNMLLNVCSYMQYITCLAMLLLMLARINKVGRLAVYKYGSTGLRMLVFEAETVVSWSAPFGASGLFERFHIRMCEGSRR